MTIIAGFKKGYNIFVKTIICRLENCIRLGTFMLICFFFNQNISKYTFVIVTYASNVIIFTNHIHVCTYVQGKKQKYEHLNCQNATIFPSLKLTDFVLQFRAQWFSNTNISTYKYVWLFWLWWVAKNFFKKFFFQFSREEGTKFLVTFFAKYVM